MGVLRKVELLDSDKDGVVITERDACTDGKCIVVEPRGSFGIVTVDDLEDFANELIALCRRVQAREAS